MKVDPMLKLLVSSLPLDSQYFIGFATSEVGEKWRKKGLVRILQNCRFLDELIFCFGRKITSSNSH